jgi:DNA-binding NarL/FixJ family response regulator
MAEGATDGRIAEQLGLSAASTRNHVGNILEKQQLESLTAAVLYAVRSRLIDH